MRVWLPMGSVRIKCVCTAMLETTCPLNWLYSTVLYPDNVVLRQS